MAGYFDHLPLVCSVEMWRIWGESVRRPLEDRAARLWFLRLGCVIMWRMDIREILDEAVRHGVTMKLGDDGRLLLRADKPPPADLLDRIRENTAAIVRHLDARQNSLRSDDPSEMFADNVRKSLRVHSEILDHPFDPEDFRMARIKSDTATAVLNVASRGSPDQLRIKQDGSRMPSPRLLKAVRRAEAAGEEDKRRALEKAAREAARNAAMSEPPDDVA
jgi:hypothetical protein